MITDSSVEVMRCRVGDEVKGELGQFVDSIGCTI